MSKNKENKLVPKLRFTEFKNKGEWLVKPLGDVLIKNSNKNKDQKYTLVESVSNKYGFIKQDEYFEDRIVASKDTSNYYVINKGYFAYNPSRIDVGSLAYKSDDNTSIISPLYVSFKANNSVIDDIFLLNFFNSNEFTKQMIFEGGVRNTLNYDNLSEIKIPTTQLNEQQKIAACLSSLDEVITAESQKLEALKEHKKGLLQNLLPQEGETVPKFRFKEFEDSGEWVEKIIQEVAKVTTGKKDTQNKVEDGKFPFFVRSQNVERINSYSFDCEAILTSGDGVGVGKNFHYIVGKFDFHQRVYCIYDFQKEVSGRYVYVYFSGHFYERVMRMSAKNSVDSVRMAMITEMPILLPNKKEQEKIADTLSSIDDLIIGQNQKLEALQLHKKGLLQGLFPNVNEVTE